MAVEPQLFLCYGRPDKDLASSLASQLWKHRIECYNYLAKPLEDRIGLELPHLGYIYSARLFIAIISSEIIWRELVVEEILLAYRLVGVTEGRCRRVYLASRSFIANLPLPPPEHFIDPIQPGGPPAIAKQLLEYMGPELVERCQKAWNINKSLYPNNGTN